MKNEELYSRIKQQRANRKSRDSIPYLNYYQKSRRIEKLLKLIEDRIKDKGSLKEALIQFIISDITAFEVYFKDLFYASIEYCVNEKDILEKCGKLTDKKFDFQDLVTILYDNIELPYIILENQNFQSLKSIDRVFSVVLKEDFLKHLGEREFHLKSLEDDDELFPPFELEEEWYTKLEKYLKLRHNLTHDYNPKINLNREEIDDLHMNLGDFILAVDIVFQDEIFQPNVVDVVTKGRKKN